MAHSPVDAALLPHEALAAAVIRLALHDARLSGPRGESARRFLSGSDALTFWCQVANVPTALVVAKAREAMASWRQQPRPHAA